LYAPEVRPDDFVEQPLVCLCKPVP